MLKGFSPLTDRGWSWVSKNEEEQERHVRQGRCGTSQGSGKGHRMLSPGRARNLQVVLQVLKLETASPLSSGSSIFNQWYQVLPT